jgi:8-oxo-dGTP pyrophosphatase MutT (NUDIX family)
MSRRINVRGIIVRDGKLFAVRHLGADGSSKGFWCTPGGGLDDGESLSAGIARELLEETGITAQVGRLLFIQQFQKTGEFESYDYDEFLEFFFLIENSDAFENINLSTTTHGAAELAEFGWIDPKTVDFLPLFLKDIDIESAITKNLPVIINNEL